MNTYHVQAQKTCFVSPISTLTWKRNNSLLPHPWQSTTTALPRRRSSFRASLFEERPGHHTCSTTNSSNNSSSNNDTNNQVWNGVRKVLRISAISATLMLSPVFQQQLQSQQQSQRKQLNFNTFVTSKIFKSSTLASPTSTSNSTTDSQTSDVEAAAMTLGAVTLGGLFMRLVINRSRDSEAEKKRLADQCDRLQKEEHIRSLRIQRTQLESLDDDPGSESASENGIQAGNDNEQTRSDLEKQMSELDSLQQVTLPSNDNDLMSDLRKRMDSINDNEDDTTNSEDDDNNNNNSNKPNNNNNNGNNNNMRHNPIPDRGTGSALLERPSSSSSASSSGGNSNNNSENGNSGDEDKAGKPDELEMLKRMWNLSPPDKKE